MSDWMTAPLVSRRPETLAALPCRAPRADDAEALARLMLDAYRGTIDDEGATIDDARAEVEKLTSGKFGTFLGQFSRVFLDENAAQGGDGLADRPAGLASAVLLTHHRGQPFIAFVMTAPAWKRRGLARCGMIRALNALFDAKETEVSLVVTRANTPAVDLYTSLGFVVSSPRSAGEANENRP